MQYVHFNSESQNDVDTTGNVQYIWLAHPRVILQISKLNKFENFDTWSPYTDKIYVESRRLARWNITAEGRHKEVWTR